MLVLSRKIGEELVLDGNIRVTVVAVKGQKVQLGVSAPPGTHVLRQELLARPKRKCSAEMVIQMTPPPTICCGFRSDRRRFGGRLGQLVAAIGRTASRVSVKFGD
jgi:carbon storage regulator